MDNSSNWEPALSDFLSRAKAARQDDIVEILLYGSRARNDADASSDIDLLVVVRESDRKVAIDKECAQIANEVSLEHDVVVSVIVFDRNQYRLSFEPLLINVRREGKKIA